jgi:hypothetical protein
MLEPESLAVTSNHGQGGAALQAGLEMLVALHLEGRIQAGLVSGPWMGSGTILGYYQPFTPGARWRRITGGPEARAGPETGYAGLVFASESLAEVVELARTLYKCLDASVWGATRVGPKPLAAGVIEVIGDFSRAEAVDCVAASLFDKKLETTNIPLPQAGRVIEAYTSPSWIHYDGAERLPFKGKRSAGRNYVEIGLDVGPDGFITAARIEGVFNAAPPGEPFSLASLLLGLPLSDDALEAFQARLSLLEVDGVDRQSIAEALREALTKAMLHNEERSGSYK